MLHKTGLIVRSVAFLLVFAVAYYFVSATLKFKYEDGITTMENYYALPGDTVDVLMVGSSHIGMNVDPSLLWEERGIASYACWASMQATWNTYYYLKECLKTQTPKLVVMDVHMTANDMEYADYESMVKSIVGMRPSRDKLQALRVSAAPEYRADVLLGFPTYHYRYADLTARDFSYYFWQRDTSIQRSYTQDRIEPIDIIDVSGVEQTMELTQKADDYLHRIIDLCAEKDVPLLLVAAPYELSENDQRRFNTVANIAAENGIPFLNFNEFYWELGIDPASSFIDPGHLNEGGIARYTEYLGAYLKEHYELPDRRQDASHIWNREAEEEQAVDGSGHLIYSLGRQFQGGAMNYLDTGVALYDNPHKDYTLLTQIDTTAEGEDMVYLACFSEEPGNYRGLLIRKESDGEIHIVFHTGAIVDLKQFGDVLTLAIVKDGFEYRIYADGSYVRSISVSAMDPYDGPLLLGCELDADGRAMRYSDVRVMALECYDTILDEATITQWAPPRLPEPDARVIPIAGSQANYEMAYAFEGDAIDRYVDTGVMLYSEADESWTLLTRFRAGDDHGSGVYLSCFAEEEGNYRGLLVRRTNPNVLNVMYGNYGLNCDVEDGQDVTLAVVKQRFDYTVYVNGEKVVGVQPVPVESYPGTLLVGAQETMGGEKMRFGAVTVYNLEVYGGVMAEEDILSWSPESKAVASRPQGSPVEYRLETPFVGDGVGGHVDTGVQLYDVADKDWMLTLTFARDSRDTGVLASCFAEEPGAYRGLLINLIDESTLSLTLGETARTVVLSSEPEQTLQIAKEGYAYTVTLNGETVIEKTQSRARPYDGTLHIGCQTQADGSPFGFSRGHVRDLSVTDAGVSGM